MSTLTLFYGVYKIGLVADHGIENVVITSEYMQHFSFWTNYCNAQLLKVSLTKIESKTLV